MNYTYKLKTYQCFNGDVRQRVIIIFITRPLVQSHTQQITMNKYVENNKYTRTLNWFHYEWSACALCFFCVSGHKIFRKPCTVTKETYNTTSLNSNKQTVMTVKSILYAHFLHSYCNWHIKILSVFIKYIIFLYRMYILDIHKNLHILLI